MNITLQPGTYVVAVSGGVDSMVLLDVLRGQPGVKLVVAHFDHGIRSDSRQDRWLVQRTARKHGLPFVYDEGKLGPGVSEAKARAARYAFLQRIRKAAQARAIITAHHQDDLVETAIINTMRGSGRRGLTALKSRPTLVRPLLDVPKSELVSYARERGIGWREDTTNTNTAYLRNRVRHYVLPVLKPLDKDKLLQELAELATLNHQIDTALVNYIHTQPKARTLDRQMFTMLPHSVANEVMAFWLRAHDIRGLNRRAIELLTTMGKTLATGKQVDIDHKHTLAIKPKRIVLNPKLHKPK